MAHANVRKLHKISKLSRMFWFLVICKTFPAEYVMTKESKYYFHFTPLF